MNAAPSTMPPDTALDPVLDNECINTLRFLMARKDFGRVSLGKDDLVLAVLNDGDLHLAFLDVEDCGARQGSHRRNSWNERILR
jgi:hypothetical protein